MNTNRRTSAEDVGSRRELPFGAWPSPITPASLARAQVGLSFPLIEGGRVHWCEGRPAEGGRVALMCREGEGPPLEVTPAGFNLRTRVHEYGGRAYAAAGDLVLGCDFAEQRIWRLAAGRAAEPLTPPSEGRLRYADLTLDPGRNRVLAVQEEHGPGGEPANRIVAIDLADGSVRPLVSGPDFVAYPTLDPGGTRLAWLAWDHPDMPWDGAALHVAELDADGVPGEPVRIAGGEGVAVIQPEWTEQGLFFLSDASGYWNLWLRCPGQEARPFWPVEADCGGPLWQLGMRWYAPLADGRVAILRGDAGFSQLALLGPDGQMLEVIETGAVEMSDLTAEGTRLVLRAGFAARPAEILEIDLANGTVTTVARAGEAPVGPAWVSAARPFTFTCADGSQGHAFHYPPTNPEVTAPPGERPPVIVRSHGGPTSQARPGLSLGHQFWTSRGFAVLDVNYRGSTGFGRAYREALYGRWGIADVEDCIAAALALVEAGHADPRRLTISGGSAGGYTTLCALAFHDAFKAGASHYGVADLEALARDTHKFESRYLDRLVGPWPEAKEVYHERSPVHFPDRVACPVIFFQGQDDKVVPPDQSERMAAALRAKGIPVALLLFPGEGHGFRRAETIEQVMAAELAFYARVFGIRRDDLVELEIDNLPAVVSPSTAPGSG